MCIISKWHKQHRFRSASPRPCLEFCLPRFGLELSASALPRLRTLLPCLASASTKLPRAHPWFIFKPFASNPDFHFTILPCNITVSFLINSAGRYLFCKLCLPWHSVHHSLSAVRKCNNLRNRGHPHKLSQSWLPNSHNINPVDYKICGNEATRLKRRMWVIRGSVWLMCELEWNRALSTMAFTSSADVSMAALEPQEDILNIHRHKLVKMLPVVNYIKIYY